MQKNQYNSLGNTLKVHHPNSSAKDKTQANFASSKSVINPGQMAQQLAEDDSPLAFGIDQPLASAISLLQVAEFQVDFPLKYQGPVFIVSTGNFDKNSINKNVSRKLSKFLNSKTAKLKHIISRIFISATPVSETESKICVKDATSLNYEIPYDDRDRKCCN